MCVCWFVCLRLSSPSGGDAAVSGSSGAGAVLLHTGPAARRCAGAGRAAAPAARRTDGHDHPARTDHHRSAAARTGSTDASFEAPGTGVHNT